jgi:hypothetical protein
VEQVGGNFLPVKGQRSGDFGRPDHRRDP